MVQSLSYVEDPLPTEEQLVETVNDVYRVDQAADPEAPKIVMEGNTEVFASSATTQV